MLDMYQINHMRSQWERNPSLKHYQILYMQQKITQYELQVDVLRCACATKEAIICAHERKIQHMTQEQNRKIKYLQNIIKNMPVVALPGVYKMCDNIDENCVTERNPNTETEDGWVLTEKRESEKLL